jgi:hypothetical protein
LNALAGNAVQFSKGQERINIGWFEAKAKDIQTKEDVVAYLEWMASLPIEKPTSILGI